MLHLNPKVSTNVKQNDMPNKPGDIKDWSAVIQTFPYVKAKNF